MVKIPRWPFDKFPDGDRTLGTQMKSTGEVMAIDRSFEAALQKAVRSLEVAAARLALGRSDLDDATTSSELIRERQRLRLWALMAALRRGATPETLAEWSGIDPLFLHKLQNIVELRARVCSRSRARRRRCSAAPSGSASPTRRSARCRRAARAVRERRARVEHPADLQDGRHLRRRVRGGHAVLLRHLRGRERSAAAAGPEGRSSSAPARSASARASSSTTARCARRWRCASAGVPSIMINSQPRDGQHRLRRLRSRSISSRSTRRACATSSRTRRSGDGEAPRGAGAVRRPDRDQPGRAAAPRGLRCCSARTCERSTWPRTATGSSDLLDQLGIPQPPGGIVTTLDEAVAIGRAARLPGAGAAVVRAGRAGDGDLSRAPTSSRATSRAAARTSRARSPVLVDKYLEGTEIEVDAICDGERRAHPRHHGARRARGRPLRRQHRGLSRRSISLPPRSRRIVDYTTDRGSRSACAACSTSST